MKFSIKDFFSKCDQIRRKLRIWSHLLKKALMENFIFRAVLDTWTFLGLIDLRFTSTDEKRHLSKMQLSLHIIRTL